MRNHVTFKSSKFNLTEQLANFINPNNFGEDLANWLYSEIERSSNLQPSESGQEDWGWYIPVSYNEKDFYINLGAYPSDESDWLLWVEPPHVGFIKKLKKVNYLQETNFVSNIINGILTKENLLTDIRWHLETDFKKGNESEWKESPTSA